METKTTSGGEGSFCEQHELQRQYYLGDKESLVRLLLQNQGPLRCLAMRQAGAQFADDALGEMYVRLLAKHATYDPTRPWLSWAKTVLSRSVVDVFRKEFGEHRLARTQQEPLHGFSDLADASPSPDELATIADLANSLRSELGALPPVLREAVIAKYVQQKRLREIAAESNCHISTAFRRIETAIGLLRARLAA